MHLLDTRIFLRAVLAAALVAFALSGGLGIAEAQDSPQAPSSSIFLPNIASRLPSGNVDIVYNFTADWSSESVWNDLAAIFSRFGTTLTRKGTALGIVEEHHGIQNSIATIRCIGTGCPAEAPALGTPTAGQHVLEDIGWLVRLDESRGLLFRPLSETAVELAFLVDDEEISDIRFTCDECSIEVTIDDPRGEPIPTAPATATRTPTGSATPQTPATPGNTAVPSATPVPTSSQPDSVPPVISGARAIPSTTSAVITWRTDEPATSSVVFGLTDDYGSGPVGSSMLTREHSVTLSGLRENTRYNYQITSTDANGNVTTGGPATFSTSAAGGSEQWAFEETFTGDPSAPSQDLLPTTLDYAVTMRVKHDGETSDGRRDDPTHAHGGYGYYMADHGADCSAPPDGQFHLNPSFQHQIFSTHRSDASAPDHNFFICRDHMMTATDPDEYYSVSAFWPRQEFNFAHGGVIEFDVNIDNRSQGSWFEVMLMPIDQIQLAGARDWLPVDETYSKDHIVFIFENGMRKLQVGTGTPPPDGIIYAEDMDAAQWHTMFPSDPANTDARIRRKHRLEFRGDKTVLWSIQKQDGTFHTATITLPQSFPFTQGLVLFKSHAVDPTSLGADPHHVTWHWDNVRFSGPKLPTYEAYEAHGVVNMEAHYAGVDGPVTQTIELPHIGANPVIMGQTRFGMPGHIRLSINGHPVMEIAPHSTSSKNDPCLWANWRTFRYSIDPSLLKVGSNIFTWSKGPVPSCAKGQWYEGFTGFSIKGLEVHFDGK